MRQLCLLEVTFRRDQIMAMVQRVRTSVPQCPEPKEVYAQLVNGAVHAWEHEGTIALAGCYMEGGKAIARVAWAAGTLQEVLRWYDAWEAECIRCQVDEMRIGGRPGWLTISRRFGYGFEYESGVEMVKRLH